MSSYSPPRRGIADAFVYLLRFQCFWPGRGEGLVKVLMIMARRNFLLKLHRQISGTGHAQLFR